MLAFLQKHDPATTEDEMLALFRRVGDYHNPVINYEDFCQFITPSLQKPTESPGRRSRSRSRSRSTKRMTRGNSPSTSRLMKSRKVQGRKTKPRSKKDSFVDPIEVSASQLPEDFIYRGASGDDGETTYSR